MTKYDIITLGSGVVDAFLETNLKEKNGNILLPTGCKILLDHLWFATGGGGTNTATSFSRLGLKTGFAGKLGKDENANLILQELKKDKIDFLGSLGNGPTGYSIVIDSGKHNRTILAHKGVNQTLKYKELKLNKFKTSWLYFSAMVSQSLKTQEKLSKWAAQKGIKIAFNPSKYLTKEGPKKIKKILSNTEVLILNKEEALDLVPKGDIFKGLQKLGPRYVCITEGKKGNKVCDRSKIFKTIPRKIPVFERTGAGDAFASGFVFGMIKFNDIKKAMLCGSLNAESVIQKPGAKNGLLTKKEILSQLKHNKIKII